MAKTTLVSMRIPQEERQILDFFARHFQQNHTAVVRQLIRQATLESFPQSWHLRVKELQQGPTPHTGDGTPPIVATAGLHEAQNGARPSGTLRVPASAWPAGDPDTLLTYEEAAQRATILVGVNITVDTVKVWGLPRIRQGKIQLIRLGDLDTYVLAAGKDGACLPGSPVAIRVAEMRNPTADGAARRNGDG